MLIYRFEKEDGGGPWFSRNGAKRSTARDFIIFPSPFKDKNFLYGCLDMSYLLRYLRAVEKTKNCYLTTYDIPVSEIYFSKNHVIFPKTYKPIKKIKYQDLLENSQDKIQ